MAAVNSRDLALTGIRTTVSSVTLTTTSDEFLLQESTPVIYPNDITLTATPANIPVGVTYKWEYALNTAATTWITISGQTASTLSITSAAYTGYLGSATSIVFKVTVSYVGWLSSSATQTVIYSREVDDVIQVLTENDNTLVSCDNAGTPTNFNNTGNTIRVLRNGKSLNYAASGASSFSIGTVTLDPAASVSLGTGTGSGTTYTYSNITALTSDTVTVSYPIIIRNLAGTVRNTITKLQKFYKIKPGAGTVTLELTNDSHVVPANAAGTIMNFAASGTDIYVYDGSSTLTYDGVGTANGTWRVTTSAPDVTPGALTDSGAYATSAILTAMPGDTGSITFNAIGKTLTGAAFSITKTQTFAKAKSGTNPIVYAISVSSPVITKQSSNNTTTGTHSTVTIQGKKYEGNTTTNYGWITVTGNGGTEAVTATDTASAAITLAPATTDTKLRYTINMYNQATVSGATLLDSETIDIVFKGDASAIFNIDNAGAVFKRDTSGNITPVAGIALTTSYLNVTGTITYQWYKDNVAISGATASTYTVPIADYSSVVTHTYKCILTGTINGIAGSTLNDNIIIPRLDDGGSAITVLLSNNNITFTGPTTGYVGIPFTNGSCNVTAYLGTTQLTYAASGNNTFSCSVTSSGVAGVTGSGTASTFSVIAPTSMSSDAAYTDITTTVIDGLGTITTTVSRITYSLSRTGATGSTGSPGTTGAEGKKTVTLTQYKWAASSPAQTTSSSPFTYTWATNSFTNTSGWSPSAGAAASSGLVLYQWNVIITDNVSATTTSADWGAAGFSSIGTIGYRQDGSIGPQGAGARIAYYVSTSSSPPLTPTSTGDAAPSGWSFTATATLTDGQYMYQSDGLYNSPTITWGVPYLSNLKVGNLAALSANLGAVTINTGITMSAAGQINSGSFIGYAWPASGGTGFHLGPSGLLLGNYNDNKYVQIGSDGNIYMPGMSIVSGSANFSGNLTVGSSPAISGTTMTGSGAKINSGGTFAIGNSTTNITFDGSQITLNGNIVKGSNIVNSSIDATKFASSIEPVTLVASVPAVKSTSTVFNTTDGKLYRWNGSSYINTLAATDISGTLAAAQVASLAASQITGTLTSAQIASIDAAKIAGTLTNAQLAAIDATKITGTLTNAQLASIDAAKLTGSITSTQITDNAITTAKIFAGAITTNQIAANTITTNNIAVGTITAGNIAAGTITAANIAAGTIVAGNIAASTITGTNIAAGTISAGNIVSNTITTNQIAVGTITAGNIAAGTITAANIAAGTITAVNIATGTITAGNIAANTITGNQIAVDTITAGNIAAGAISASELAAGAVTAGKISVNNLSAISGRLGSVTLNADPVTLSNGAISSGAFTGYAWPAAGSSGFYLGPEGLLMGNYNDGKWVQIDATGTNINLPGLTITNGSATFKGTLTVGSSPAISGTTMTGSGAKIESGGNFAIGNASTNISFNGSQMTLNGNVVSTTNMLSGTISDAYSATNTASPDYAEVVVDIPTNKGTASAILISYYLGPETLTTTSTGAGKDAGTGFFPGPIVFSLTDNNVACTSIILDPAPGPHTIWLQRRNYKSGSTMKLNCLVIYR